MAPVDPLAVNQTIIYEGGTVTAPRGTLAAMFPSTAPSWFPNGESGLGRRPFGSRQRSTRQAGEDLTVQFIDGSAWVVRVTGGHTNFLTRLLVDGNVDTVAQVWSERGTIYGPQYRTIGPSNP